MKLNNKEKKLIISTLIIWSFFFIISGIIMNNTKKVKTITNYKINVSTKNNSEIQNKKIEIKLKELETEIGTPLSLNVIDYLIDGENIQTDIIKQLQLDTSLVNPNQAGTYIYTIKYNKKIYQGNIKVKETKEKETKFTLKNISLYIGDAISTDKKTYIVEKLTDEVYNQMQLDLSNVNNSTSNDSKYYIIYNNTRYEGTISFREKVILPQASINSTPTENTATDETIKCNDNQTYNETTKKCEEKNLPN